MINIVTKGSEWNKILIEIGSYDMYHTYDYHKVLSREDEEPILIVYSQDKSRIAFPFLKRRINNTFYDLTSVHGYLGPIFSGNIENFDNEYFHENFKKLLVSENIVSAFAKLNPFIPNQKKVLALTGNIEDIGELVYFDQTIDDETQKSHYKKNTRRSLKKLQQISLVREPKNNKEIDQFIQMYYKTMDRLNANEIFYFGEKYFQTLLNSNLFEAKILLAVNTETNEIMSGILATQSNEICHIELVCTNDEYFSLSPSRILYDETRGLLKNDQIKYLVLGGGSGGREGSLMRFKSSFTQHYADFEIWKFISMPEVYENLQTPAQKSAESNFFPKYRLIEK